MTRWQPTARDEHRALAHVIRLNAQRYWDSLGAWEQIMAAGVLWTAFWALALHAAYPWLERMVTA